jgi:hypothetical protein
MCKPQKDERAKKVAPPSARRRMQDRVDDQAA